jgi:hypothetical protein
MIERQVVFFPSALFCHHHRNISLAVSLFCPLFAATEKKEQYAVTQV